MEKSQNIGTKSAFTPKIYLVESSGNFYGVFCNRLLIFVIFMRVQVLILAQALSKNSNPNFLIHVMLCFGGKSCFLTEKPKGG